MVLTLSILVILLLVGVFVFCSHVRLKKQYKKKQQADAKLFQPVLENMNQHLSAEEAKRKFNIGQHGFLLHSIKEKTKYPLTQNDRIEVLLNGDQKYPALFKSIEQAQHHVHLLYYTVQNDQIGQELQQLLIKKVKQGVEVRLLIDGVGSKELLKSKSVLKHLKEAGVECAVFAPQKLSFLLRLNFRNHRKIAVIDGRVGFTGGLNVGDEYLHKDPKKGYWRDIHVLVEGESVLLLQRIFATDWYYVTNKKVKEDEQFFPQFTQEGTQQSDTDTALVQVVPSGPDMDLDVMKHVYKDMFLSAKEKIWIATPYFAPDQMIMNALKEARKKGVEISLLVPKKTDNALVQAASFHYLLPLLYAGVKIYQYQKGFYHAKMALVDDKVAEIGSANLDQRSLNYSFEAGLFIYHKETCQEVKEIFEQDFKDCTLLQPSQVKNRSFLQRIGTQFSVLLAPWL
jgi:cardiolipin synthase